MVGSLVMRATGECSLLNYGFRKGERAEVKEGPIKTDLYPFLTSEPDDVVGPIFHKAMPTILQNEDAGLHCRIVLPRSYSPFPRRRADEQSHLRDLD